MMFRNGTNFAKSLHFCKIKTAAALIARGSRRLNCQITSLVFLCFIAVAFVAIAFVAVAVVHGLVLSAAVTVLMDVSFAVAAFAGCAVFAAGL